MAALVPPMTGRSVQPPRTSVRDVWPSVVAVTPAVRFMALSADARGCNLDDLMGRKLVTARGGNDRRLCIGANLFEVAPVR
jgi:hypothetical protein